MHAPRYTTCASKLQLQQARCLSLPPSLPSRSLLASCFHSSLLSLSLSFVSFFSLTHALSLSLFRGLTCTFLLRLAKLVGNSGLLNNSLCGLAEMRARVLTQGYFAKLPARCHTPRVTATETSLFRRRRFHIHLLLSRGKKHLTHRVPMTAEEPRRKTIYVSLSR